AGVLARGSLAPWACDLCGAAAVFAASSGSRPGTPCCRAGVARPDAAAALNLKEMSSASSCCQGRYVFHYGRFISASELLLRELEQEICHALYLARSTLCL